MNRSTTAVLALILAGILFLAINVFSANSFRSARLDLTDQGLYTLSAGSTRILAEVPEPIRLRFYFSEKLAIQLPNIKSYGLRVRELLEEYVNRSNGKIRLEVIDPEPFTQAEDDAVRLGLQAAPLGTGENLYFGLVATNTIDDRQVVPFFSREKEAFLEYDLTRMIFNLSDPKKPVVGLITGLEMNADASPMMRFSGGAQPWAIIAAIREVFDLRTLQPNQGVIPKDVDILLIAHPRGLSEPALCAIDQFVMAGGRALIFVDPFSEVMARSKGRGQPPGAALATSTLDKLLQAWGVSVATDHVIADYEAAQEVNAGQGGAQRIVRYLVWLQIAAGNMNPEDVITADLGPMIMANAGTVKALEGTATEVTPLITTGTQAMRMETNLIRFGPAPDRLLEIFKADGEHHMIAARLGGTANSAYPDGAPETEAKAGGQARPHLTASSKDIGVIVVADTDLLHEQFWLRKQNMMGRDIIVPIAANADFVINALDNLAGSSDLIGLRSRGKSTRPFVVVQSMRLAAEQKFLAEERKLKENLEKSKGRIAELESRAQAGGGSLLTEQQQAEIKTIRAQVLKTRRQLRDVQHNLNRDIDNLEAKLKFTNIGLMPLAVALVAAILALIGVRRRRVRAVRS
ncbi:MAG: ABC transporter [Rhodospirillaceae bacterium]|nr:ABC transporter [Rhodospirillaceae bacterium]